MSDPAAIAVFRRTLEEEARALAAVAIPDAAIGAAVGLMLAADGHVVCCGIGKSGLVAAKVAATLSSLGTSAVFMNAAEAAHGDLGAVRDGGVVILFSNSGTTAEITLILPMLKARGCRLIGIVGRPDSPLAEKSDVLLSSAVPREADPLGLAPTSSTTVQMALGDALAVAVSQARGFTREDFLRQHPAGLLGRQMMPIAQIMRTGERLPVARPETPMADVLSVITEQRLGAACIVDGEGRLAGIVTDHDVRRLLLEKRDVYGLTAADMMTRTPRTVPVTALAADVLSMMTEKARHQVMPVVGEDGRLEGILDTLDLF